mmetsp:Transcript_1941/g.5617  ORF Transcript_1941/g.5617 Transcript_1941/m.5617 type:complete len:204 (+) Transcript_1941:800-1411(+)
MPSTSLMRGGQRRATQRRPARASGRPGRRARRTRSWCARNWPMATGTCYGTRLRGALTHGASVWQCRRSFAAASCARWSSCARCRRSRVRWRPLISGCSAQHPRGGLTRKSCWSSVISSPTRSLTSWASLTTWRSRMGPTRSHSSDACQPRWTPFRPSSRAVKCCHCWPRRSSSVARPPAGSARCSKSVQGSPRRSSRRRYCR